MTTAGGGKPSLTLCPTCKLPFAVDKNPDGCPHCRANPGLGGVIAAQEREAADEYEGVLAVVVRLWSSNVTRAVAAGAGAVLLVLVYAFSGNQAAHHLENLRDERRQLYERGCAFAGAEPASPAMDACVKLVESQCRNASPLDVQACAEAAARGGQGAPP